MEGALWTLVRWMAEVVVTGNIENSWFSDFPSETWNFLHDVGYNITQLF